MSNDLPDGFYEGRALRGEFGKSKEKGTDQVLVQFEITKGDHAGKRVFWYGYFGANSEKRSVESLRLCGCTFPGGDIFNLDGLSSNDVSLDVQTEIYEGKPRQRVAWVNELGGAGLARQMDEGEKLSFRERMKGTVLATAGTGPAPAAPPANGTSSRPQTSQPPQQRGARPF